MIKMSDNNNSNNFFIVSDEILHHQQISSRIPSMQFLFFSSYLHRLYLIMYFKTINHEKNML